MLVLRAPREAECLPRHMVKGGVEIVDGVAYYQGEISGQVFHESDLDNWLSCLRIVLDAKSVRFALDEGLKLPFKLRNVRFCPLNL